MADLDYDHAGSMGHPVGERLGRIVNIGGAVCSLALIAGLAVWGYNLAVRDVTGIPVIRAVGGPLRMAPEQPGGKEAAHQGLSVNAVAAAGTAAPLPEHLRLAPAPVALAEEDVAGLADLPATAPVDAAATLSALPENTPPQAQDAVAAALAEALVADAAAPVIAAEMPAAAVEVSLPAAPQADALAAVLAEAIAAPVEAAPVEVATVSAIRPRARPLAQPAVARSSDSAPVGQVTAADLTPVASGAPLAQLGAFDDQDTARREWERLSGLQPALFAGKAPVIESAVSGGRTFYRLRASGFDSRDAVRSFCSQTLEKGISCIPATAT